MISILMTDFEIFKRWHLDIETLSNFNNLKFYSWTSSISEYIKTVWNTKIVAENVQLVTRVCWMNGHFNTSVVVPAKLSFVTSQQPSFSPLAWRRGCKVCTCWRLSAWSSLIHGGKSAPTDTNCDSEGPINGLGRLVYMTVMLPRNVSGSKTNNTYLLAYLHQCLLYLHNKLSIRSLFRLLKKLPSLFTRKLLSDDVIRSIWILRQGALNCNNQLRHVLVHYLGFAYALE